MILRRFGGSEMRFHCIVVVLIASVILSFSGEAAFDYLNGSGRSDALGGCGVAGIGSSLENPANVVLGENFNLALSHNDLYNLGIPVEFLEIKGELFRIPLSFTINRLTDSVGPYNERAYTFTMGKKFQNLAAGISLRRLLLEAEAAGAGWAIDLGGTYKINQNTIGIAARNFFGTLNYSTGRNEMPNSILSIGLTHSRGDTIYIAEMENFKYLKLGLERSFGNDLMLRVGYTEHRLTAGIGLRKGKITFDYAYVPHALGNAHRLFLKLGL